jgi:hypothetical protein
VLYPDSRVFAINQLLAEGMVSYCEGVDRQLGEDLLLLALDAGRGSLERTFVISYALTGAELVQLAASGRIDIVNDQIVLISRAPTGDAELDAALARIGEPDSPSRPGEWVARPLPGIIGRYLERLRGAGVICKETGFRIKSLPGCLERHTMVCRQACVRSRHAPEPCRNTGRNQACRAR